MGQTDSNKRLALGLDLSTQSLSAVVLDIDAREAVLNLKVGYARDLDAARYGIRTSDYILPPREDGEAEQPPAMYFEAMDSLLAALKESELPMENIAVVNCSAQQHGHVYLNQRAEDIFARLNSVDSASLELSTLLDGCLSCETAPIWMTSNTSEEATYIREYVGGKDALIGLTGSDIPLRFTAATIRRIGKRSPDTYDRTETIQLLSALLPAILTGNSKAPTDFGNACSTSLMDYANREWSDLLIAATAEGLPGGANALRDKLTAITAPDAQVATIAQYFVEKYGFSPSCRILAGSGDNPQSKVLVEGDLLSLGTSFVFMVATDGKTVDTSGMANAMYDGLGRPFLFGCRTNGALVWDRLREMHGIGRDDYSTADSALERQSVATSMVFWQPRGESFPPSGPFELTRMGDSTAETSSDFAGLVETSLCAVYLHSREFTRDTDEPLYVTGGASGSHGVLRRVAAIWNRSVIPIDEGGAALGAAVAGACALLRTKGQETDAGKFSESLLKRRESIAPDPDDVSAFHSPGGYFEGFAEEEARLLASHPA